MGKLAARDATKCVKLLAVGESGSGKTGALASLAEAGYNLRIIDLDNGVDILSHALKNKPEALDRVYVETITEKMKGIPTGAVIPDGIPKMWSSVLNLLNEWKVPERKRGDIVTDPAYNLGKITDWGPDTVLVIDSLSMLSLAAMRHVLAINNRLGKAPYQSDWGDAMTLIEGLLGMLYSESVRCNVVVNTHITYIGGEDEKDDQGNKNTGLDILPMKGYPNTLGKKLPPKVGMYFNNLLLFKTQSSRRIIKTRPDGLIDVKSAVPDGLPAELPIETGLRTFFEKVRGPLKA